MAISVAPSSGIAVFRPMAVIASRRGFPSFRSIRMPSTITMALSTSIPMARMNAASDTRCMEPSIVPSSRKEPMTMITRLVPMMTPLLNPMTSISIATTMMTDSIRLMKNVPRASITRSGW